MSSPYPLGGPQPCPKEGGGKSLCVLVLCCTLTALSTFSHILAPLAVLLHTRPHLCTLSHSPAHLCTHLCLLLHSPAHSYTPSMLPQPRTPVHALTHLDVLLHTRAHTLTCPVHLCTLSPSVAHLYTHLHTCARSCTPLCVFPQPCTLFHSLNALTALHTCAFHPLCKLSPPCAHSHTPVPSGPAPVLLHTPCTLLPPRVLPCPSCPCPALGALARSTRSCMLTPSPPRWPQLLGVPYGFTPLPGCPLCVPHGWSGLTPLSRRVQPGMLRGAEH